MNLYSDNSSPSYADDASRPIYHFLPSRNWMNDPNGVIQWKGRYHLFFQYNPSGAYHDNMHWGHSVSDDLIHWQHLPVALAPDAGTVDEGGIFSGCIVDNNGIPTAFYTGVNHGASLQRQCMAVGDDDLITWVKHATNPVIAAPPVQSHQITDFRDPFVWRDGDDWFMAIGSRIEGVGGTVFLYRSSDLQEWHYLNPLYVGDTSRHGPMWECPNFFQLGEKWVLVVSSHTGQTTGKVLYFVGDYQDHRFYPQYEAVLDSDVYYAPLTHLDDNGRRLIWGWIRETRSSEEQLEAGWSGVQAIPRVLTLDDKCRLQMDPVPEIEQLRRDHASESYGLAQMPFSVPGLALDVEVIFEIKDTQICGLHLKWPGTDRYLTIFYDPLLETLNIHNSSQDPSNTLTRHGRLHRLDSGEPLSLRILLDQSVVEIIANRRTSITHRIYPDTFDLPQMDIENKKAVTTFALWEMATIWK